jgi:hypothetical protein
MYLNNAKEVSTGTVPVKRLDDRSTVVSLLMPRKKLTSPDSSLELRLRALL